MNRRDRSAKRRRRQHHTTGQSSKREQALAEATDTAANIGAKGQRLKKPRTGDAFDKALVSAMYERGYVQNGKGGWRPLHKVTIRDKRISIEKEV